MEVRDDRLFWLDLETTGLDADQHEILEVAAVVTEADLTPVAHGSWVVWQPESALDQMPAVVRAMHESSGLLKAVRGPTSSLLGPVEARLRQFMEANLVLKTAPLCGNSIGTLDRPFLRRHMPTILPLLHYRMVDVSSLKELVNRWAPQWAYGKKKLAHRALDDVRESLDEARWYKEALFGPQTFPAQS